MLTGHFIMLDSRLYQGKILERVIEFPVPGGTMVSMKIKTNTFEPPTGKRIAHKKTCMICSKRFWSPSWKPNAKYCGRQCAQRGAATSPAKVAYLNKIRGTGKTGGYVKRNGMHEHRVVAESMLGRKLRKGEIVHHKNGKRYDNRPSNIVILKSQSEHCKVHGFGYLNKLKGGQAGGR